MDDPQPAAVPASGADGTITYTLTPAPTPNAAPVASPGSEVGWTLTAVGIVASLGWNWFNYHRMSGLQRSIRSETVRVEEFRRIRTPIDAKLSEFRAERETLRSLASSGLTLEELRPAAGEAQKSLTARFVGLSVALDDADQSNFASGGDWLAPVNGVWDEVVSKFDIVQSAIRPETDVRDALMGAADKLEKIARIIGDRIDREMAEYAGASPPR